MQELFPGVDRLHSCGEVCTDEIDAKTELMSVQSSFEAVIGWTDEWGGLEPLGRPDRDRSLVALPQYLRVQTVERTSRGFGPLSPDLE